MRIINLLYKGSRINYGVWVSAISTAKRLREEYGIESEVWFPSTEQPLLDSSIKTIQLENTRINAIQKLIKTHQLNPQETIIQSHGSWRFQSRWGFAFRQRGFKWVYHPHGMLNQHGFEEKALKKTIYWQLIEHFLLRQANAVRLVTSVEKNHLIKKIGPADHLFVIPNGIESIEPDLSAKDKAKKYVLFMSRLFHGKGVVPMVEAWLKSHLNDHPEFELIIAGPDQGELEKVNLLFQTYSTTNVKYIGPIYKEEKELWLKRSTFYILPSFSEAFSTSILEGMSYGLIPLITPNCNFPEVFQEGIGIQITPDVEGIRLGFEQLPLLNPTQIEGLQVQAAQFVNNSYTLDKIAFLQFKMFNRILQNKDQSVLSQNTIQQLRKQLILTLF